MRLDVRVLCAEERLRALDGEQLDLVDHLATAVVAAPWVPLGVLVGRDAPDRLHHGRPREVLGGDELDLVPLALELAAEESERSPGRRPRDPRCGDPRAGAARSAIGADATARARRSTRASASAAANGALAERRGLARVRSRTVDGAPGSSPRRRPQRLASGSRQGRPRAVAGSAPPWRFALVAATAPTAVEELDRARPRTSGTRTPIVSVRAPVSHGKRRAGFGRTSV